MNYYLGVTALIAMWGSLPYLTKKLVGDTSTIEMMMFFTSVLWVVFMTLILSIYPGTYSGGRLAELTSFFQRVSWWQLAIWTFGSFVASTMVYHMLLRDHPAYKVVSVSSIFPLVTLILGLTLFREHITPQQIVGVLAIVIGLVIIHTGARHDNS